MRIALYFPAKQCLKFNDHSSSTSPLPSLSTLNIVSPIDQNPVSSVFAGNPYIAATQHQPLFDGFHFTHIVQTAQPFAETVQTSTT